MMKKILMTLLLLVAGLQTMQAQEAYAALSNNNTVLTFYYDKQKPGRNGMSIGPFLQINGTDRGWHEYRDKITTVVFAKSFASYTGLTSTAYWFYGCENLTTIEGIENLKTDNVTDMESMFESCSSLASLDVSNFKTEKVTNMSGMFFVCSSLTSLDVSNFKTEKVTNMSYMFYRCMSLTTLDLSSFNTEKVTNMYCMFWGCSSLTTIYVGNDWSVDNLVNSYRMFYNCTSLVGGNGTTYSSSHTDSDYACIDKPGQPGYLTDFTELTRYDLWVGGVQVTDANKDNIDGTGKVKYNPSTKTLSLLDGVNITGHGRANDGTTGYGAGIYSAIDGLTIDVEKGNSTVRGADDCHGIELYRNTTIKGDGLIYGKGYIGVYLGSGSSDLTVDGNVTLLAESTTYYGLCGYSRTYVGNNTVYYTTLTIKGNAVVQAKGELSSVCRWKDLVLENHAIISPAGAVWNTDKHAVCDASGNPITGECVVIKRTSLRGDTNNDGKVDIADVVTILNAMASESKDPIFDVNGDTKVDIADVVSVLNLMADQ